MDTAIRPPSYSRRPETVDHNREREKERMCVSDLKNIAISQLSAFRFTLICI